MVTMKMMMVLLMWRKNYNLQTLQNFPLMFFSSAQQWATLYFHISKVRPVVKLSLCTYFLSHKFVVTADDLMRWSPIWKGTVEKSLIWYDQKIWTNDHRVLWEKSDMITDLIWSQDLNKWSPGAVRKVWYDHWLYMIKRFKQMITGCCTRVAATPTHGLQIVFRHFSCTRKLQTGNVL